MLTPAVKGCQFPMLRPVPVLRDGFPRNESNMEYLVAPLRRALAEYTPPSSEERRKKDLDFLLRKADVYFEEADNNAGYPGYVQPMLGGSWCVQQIITRLLGEGISQMGDVDLVEHAFRYANAETIYAAEDFIVRGAQRLVLRGLVYDSSQSTEVAPFLAIDLRKMTETQKMALTFSVKEKPKVEQSHLVLDDTERNYLVIRAAGHETPFHCLYDPQRKIFELRPIGYFCYNYGSSGILVNGVRYFEQEHNSARLTKPVVISTEGLDRVVVDLNEGHRNDHGHHSYMVGGLAFILRD